MSVNQGFPTSLRRHALAAACTVAALSLSAALSGCGSSDDDTPAPTTLPALSTLDGKQPLVVGHRGASGYLPEHTIEAYTLAINQGADVIEPDLVITKDGVLIARHDPNLIYSTNVASIAKFADRKKTILVDGASETGWFASDFTLAEIKELGAIITTDATRPKTYDGLYKIPTLQEIINLAKSRSTSTRTVAIYPETKNPTFHRDLGLPLEDKLIDILTTAGWNSKTAPVYVQSFEPSSLKYLRSKGLATKMIQLIDADDYDLKTGKLTYAAPYDKPYDWAKAGDTRLFSYMVTAAGLAEIKVYADGIGPWKPYIVPVKGDLDASGNMKDLNGDGVVNYADARSQTPTTLIADAHKAGLFVHAYTFRNEQRRLAYDYNGDPLAEFKQFYRIGLDGLFTDFPDTAVAARAEYLKEMGR